MKTIPRLLLDARSHVSADDDTMVSFIRFQSQLFERLDSFFSQLLHFTSEHGFGIDGRVDTVGLDGDDDKTTVLQEHVRVQSDDSRLIGLGDIGEHGVNHTHEHTVLLRVSGVINNGDDVRSLLGHTNQLSTGTVGEFHSVHQTFRADNVSDVRHRGTGGGTQVQHLLAGSNAQFVNTTHDTGGKLRSERVPHTVFDLGGGLIAGTGFFDGYSLFPVHGFTGSNVLGDKQIFLTTGNENAGVTVL